MHCSCSCALIKKFFDELLTWQIAVSDALAHTVNEQKKSPMYSHLIITE